MALAAVFAHSQLGDVTRLRGNHSAFDASGEPSER
jgi:hypothetical protein